MATDASALRFLIDMMSPLSPVAADVLGTLAHGADAETAAAAALRLRTLVQGHIGRLPQAQRLPFSFAMAALLRTTEVHRDALAALGAMALGRSEADARRALLAAIQALQVAADRQVLAA